MLVAARSALRILIRRRNSPAHLRGETRQLIRQAIARIHAAFSAAQARARSGRQGEPDTPWPSPAPSLHALCYGSYGA